MPIIPAGTYSHPLGELVIRMSDNYHAIVEFFPGDSGIHEGVATLTWFWNADSFDGTEATGRGTLPEEVLEKMSQFYGV